MTTMPAPFPTVRAADLQSPPAVADRFMIESLWTQAAVGIIGGAPKCCKSWLGLDMAVSVASATPCLGRFPVIGPPAPVLLFMAEDDAAAIRNRIEGVAAARGLSIHGLDIHVITANTLRLDMPADRTRLVDTVRAHSPRMVLLDPFIRLHAIDENDARAVSTLLGYLRELQRTFHVAVVVTHHARKNGSAQAGQDLRGSGDFFAWADSLVYLRRHRDSLSLSVQHRSAVALQPLDVKLVPSGSSAHLEIATVPPETPENGAPDVDNAVLEALRRANAPLHRHALRAELRIRNETLGLALQRLSAANLAARHGDRWAPIPVPVPQPLHTDGNRNGNAT